MIRDEASSRLKVPSHTVVQEKRLPENFNLDIKIVDALVRRQQRIRFLRLGEEQHQRLADKLGSCEKSRRCKLEADPVCATLFRQKLCRALVRFWMQAHGQ